MGVKKNIIVYFNEMKDLFSHRASFLIEGTLERVTILICFIIFRAPHLKRLNHKRYK